MLTEPDPCRCNIDPLALSRTGVPAHYGYRQRIKWRRTWGLAAHRCVPIKHHCDVSSL